jgi:hypothetical protein
MSTFIFDDIVMGNGTISSDPYRIPLVSYCDKSLESSFKRKSFYNKGDTILAKSTPSQTLMLPQFQNGLLGTIFTAYSLHIPLKLTPDDIWLAILISFSKYVKNNSETMRNKCVKHDGKKALIVTISDNPVESIDNWETIMELLADKMAEHTQDDIIDWTVCDFSTSTSKEKFISRIALFSAFRNFFGSYARASCGLSKVTLEGTIDDWKRIVEKAQNLYTFEQPILSQWADVLIPVLTEFVNAYQGNVNRHFWQRICTHIPLGSAGDKKFRGWFMVFSPFSKEGDYMLRSSEKIKADNIYCNIMDTDVTDCHVESEISMEDCYGIHNVTLFGGLLMTDYNSNTNTLSPTRDYAIIKAPFVDKIMLKRSFMQSLSQEHNKVYYDKKEAEFPGFYKEFYEFLVFVYAELNVPNNLLLKISHDYADNILDYKERVSEKTLSDTYDSLSNKFYELHEFFPQGKKDELIKKFLQQYVSNVKKSVRPSKVGTFIEYLCIFLLSFTSITNILLQYFIAIILFTCCGIIGNMSIFSC